MKKQLIRAVGLMLALTVLPIAPDAQRGRRTTDPPDDGTGDWCAANGIRCFFGSAGGCEVFCTNGGRAICISARCPFGFPVSAECFCQ